MMTILVVMMMVVVVRLPYARSACQRSHTLQRVHRCIHRWSVTARGPGPWASS